VLKRQSVLEDFGAKILFVGGYLVGKK